MRKRGRICSGACDIGNGTWQRWRSEEHTSELQSRPHLVCRLLLEKKNSHIALKEPTCFYQVSMPVGFSSDSMFDIIKSRWFPAELQKYSTRIGPPTKLDPNTAPAI